MRPLHLSFYSALIRVFSDKSCAPARACNSLQINRRQRERERESDRRSYSPVRRRRRRRLQRRPTTTKSIRQPPGTCLDNAAPPTWAGAAAANKKPPPRSRVVVGRYIIARRPPDRTPSIIAAHCRVRRVYILAMHTTTKPRPRARDTIFRWHPASTPVGKSPPGMRFLQLSIKQQWRRGELLPFILNLHRVARYGPTYNISRKQGHYILFLPIPWGHSGPLCHALSLSSSSLWTSHVACAIAIAGVRLATPGDWQCNAARSTEWAQHFSNASCYREAK